MVMLICAVHARYWTDSRIHARTSHQVSTSVITTKKEQIIDFLLVLSTYRYMTEDSEMSSKIGSGDK